MILNLSLCWWANFFCERIINNATERVICDKWQNLPFAHMQVVKMERVPAPLGGLVHPVGVASQNLLCVMVFGTVLVVLMK